MLRPILVSNKIPRRAKAPPDSKTCKGPDGLENQTAGQNIHDFLWPGPKPPKSLNVGPLTSRFDPTRAPRGPKRDPNIHDFLLTVPKPHKSFGGNKVENQSKFAHGTAHAKTQGRGTGTPKTNCQHHDQTKLTSPFSRTCKTVLHGLEQ